MHLAFAALLGGDQDNAVGSAGAVDGGGGSVLENGNLLNVTGIQVGQGAFDSVDDHQRIVVVHGVVTTDVHGRNAARSGTSLLDDETGGGTLETFQHVVDGLAFQFFGGDGGHGAGEVHLLLHTVTHYHGVVQKEAGLFQGDVNLRAAGHVHLLGLVADGREDQHRTGRGLDGVKSVNVGHCTLRGAFDHDRSANDRFSVGNNRTGNPVGVLCDGRASCRSANEHGKHSRQPESGGACTAAFSELG